MKVSDAGLLFIQSNESFSATIYNDNGKPAIGYGHDILANESFVGPITVGMAEDFLIEDLIPIENYLTQVETTLNQNQFDALTDFAYNEGLEALHMLLSHGLSSIPVQVLLWKYIHTSGVAVVSNGLLARRNKELTLFNS